MHYFFVGSAESARACFENSEGLLMKIEIEYCGM